MLRENEGWDKEGRFAHRPSQGCRNRGKGFLGPCPPPDCGRSVNPISTREDRLFQPHYYLTPQIFRPSYGPSPLPSLGSPLHNQIWAKLPNTLIVVLQLHRDHRPGLAHQISRVVKRSVVGPNGTKPAKTLKQICEIDGSYLYLQQFLHTYIIWFVSFTGNGNSES